MYKKYIFTWVFFIISSSIQAMVLQGNSSIINRWNKLIEECIQQPYTSVIIRVLVNEDQKIYKRTLYIDGKMQSILYEPKVHLPYSFKYTASGTNNANRITWTKSATVRLTPADIAAQYVPANNIPYITLKNRN